MAAWFMTLPKSIRGLSCLHPKGPAALPHLAEGRGGRPGGCRGGGVGGKREPSVGRREGGLQAEPPSLPGTSPEKEGRKEGGRREGRERRGEGGERAEGFRSPQAGPRRWRGPRSPPSPLRTPKAAGCREVRWGGPGLGGGRGVPGGFFPPLPSLLSLLTLFLLFPLSGALPVGRAHAQPRSPRLPRKRP